MRMCLCVGNGSSIRLLNFSPAATMSPPAAKRKLDSSPAAETPASEPMMRRTSTGRRVRFQTPSPTKGRGVKVRHRTLL